MVYAQLADALFEKSRELCDKKERHIKAYEIAFQETIERFFPSKPWWDVTDCQIFMHLLQHGNPELTVVAILEGLKGVY